MAEDDDGGSPPSGRRRRDAEVRPVGCFVGPVAALVAAYLATRPADQHIAECDGSVNGNIARLLLLVGDLPLLALGYLLVFLAVHLGAQWLGWRWQIALLCAIAVLVVLALLTGPALVELHRLPAEACVDLDPPRTRRFPSGGGG